MQTKTDKGRWSVWWYADVCIRSRAANFWLC